jgi:hypothetical protein
VRRIKHHPRNCLLLLDIDGPEAVELRIVSLMSLSKHSREASSSRDAAEQVLKAQRRCCSGVTKRLVLHDETLYDFRMLTLGVIGAVVRVALPSTHADSGSGRHGALDTKEYCEVHGACGRRKPGRLASTGTRTTAALQCCIVP